MIVQNKVPQAASGNRENKVRARDQLRRDAPVRQHQCKPPGMSRTGQRFVNLVDGIIAHGDHGMRPREIHGGIQRLSLERPPVQQAGIVIVDDQLRPDLRRQNGEHPEPEIQITIADTGGHGFTAELADRKVDARRMLPQIAHQIRQQHGPAIIRHGQAEPVAGALRVETLRSQHTAHSGQRIRQRLGDFQRPDGRNKPATLAHQQRIPQQLPQPRKSVADSGLAHVQPCGSARNMAFRQKRVEYHQKIEVNRPQTMHLMHVYLPDTNFTFAKTIPKPGSKFIKKDSPMQFQAPFALLGTALLAGAVVPFQAGANAAMGRALGHPLWATVVSLGVSMLCVIPVMLAMKVPFPSLGNLAGQPKWIWAGGLAGVIYITAAILVAPKLGAAGFMTAVIAGQLAASLLVDAYGLMGFSARDISPSRLVGILLVVAGVLLIQAGPFLRASSASGSGN